MVCSKDVRILSVIRKVIIDMSMCSYRDLKFFLQSENKEQRRKIYNKELVYEEGKRYSVVCNNFCYMIRNYLVDKYGFDVEVITCDNDEFGHRDILVTIGNNKYIINCLSDLERNQMGMRPLRFASEKYYLERYADCLDNISFLTKDEVMNIDKSIGFYSDFYFDEVIDVLKKEFDKFDEYLNNDLGLKNNLVGFFEIKDFDYLKLKVLFLCKYFNQKYGLIGHIEFMRICKLLFKHLFTKEELSKIKIDNCFFDKKCNNKYEEIFECDDDRVRFVSITLDDSVFIVSVKSDNFSYKTLEDWNHFKFENKVYSCSMVCLTESISEVLRNKGIGVNILKHYVVKEKLSMLDSLFLSHLSFCDVSKFINNISKQGNCICLGSVDGIMYQINLYDDKIEFCENNSVVSYYYSDDNLVEEYNDNPSKSILYVWNDECNYKKIKYINNKVKKIAI